MSTHDDPRTVVIDGARGEGGGQILRTSLTLSVALGVPIQVRAIRAGRKRPGLLRQHLACVRAAAAICDGHAEGAELGSTSLRFTPGSTRAGHHEVRIGGAGSTTLVLQTALLPLLLTGGSSTLHVHGGTHNPWAPPYEAFALSFQPLLAAMGAPFESTLARPGFHPAGGGMIAVTVPERPAVPRPLSVLERGAAGEHEAHILSSLIDRGVAHREWLAVREALGWPESRRRLRYEDGAGPGNAINIALRFEHVTEVVTSLGERSRSAERVAATAARDVRRYLAHDAPVADHLADQLLLPMALLAGGTFRTTRTTPHFDTNVDTLSHFLGDVVDVARHDDHDVRVTVRGRHAAPDS